MDGVAGGPAGNATLTAWLGVIALALILAQLVTLLDVDGWINWHVTIGALLVPVAVFKTGATGWRVLRYYRRDDRYHAAGAPPMPLRILGPLVVVTTLGLLATGVALIVVGPSSGRTPFLTVAGFGVDVLTLHQVLFFAFATATGLHLLARFVPAVQHLQGHGRPTVPGRRARGLVLGVLVLLSVLTAVLLVSSDSSWRHDHHHRFHHPAPDSTAAGSPQADR